MGSGSRSPSESYGDGVTAEMMDWTGDARERYPVGGGGGEMQRRLSSCCKRRGGPGGGSKEKHVHVAGDQY